MDLGGVCAECDPYIMSPLELTQNQKSPHHLRDIRDTKGEVTVLRIMLLSPWQR